jgi:DNA-binding transcriptional LysR family regulator
VNWSLQDLRQFVAIAETGSLSKAAERAHTAVSALSARLKGLEEVMGTQLMIRSSKGMSLTPAGHRLLAHARDLFEKVQHLDDDMSDYAQQARGLVRIAANTTAVTEYLPEALADVMCRNAKLEISLIEVVSSEVVRSVREGRADLGIFTPGLYTDDLEVLPFRSDALVLTTSDKHVWARRGQIEFAQTLVSDHICLQRSAALFDFLVQRAREQGLVLRSRIHVAGFEAVARMVGKGVGVAVMPRSAAVRLSAAHALAVVELSDAWAANELCIGLRERSALSSSALAVLEVLRPSVS